MRKARVGPNTDWQTISAARKWRAANTPVYSGTDSSSKFFNELTVWLRQHARLVYVDGSGYRLSPSGVFAFGPSEQPIAAVIPKYDYDAIAADSAATSTDILSYEPPPIPELPDFVKALTEPPAEPEPPPEIDLTEFMWLTPESFLTSGSIPEVAELLSILDDLWIFSGIKVYEALWFTESVRFNYVSLEVADTMTLATVEVDAKPILLIDIPAINGVVYCNAMVIKSKLISIKKNPSINVSEMLKLKDPLLTNRPYQYPIIPDVQVSPAAKVVDPAWMMKFFDVAPDVKKSLSILAPAWVFSYSPKYEAMIMYDSDPELNLSPIIEVTSPLKIYESYQHVHKQTGAYEIDPEQEDVLTLEEWPEVTLIGVRNYIQNGDASVWDDEYNDYTKFWTPTIIGANTNPIYGSIESIVQTYENLISSDYDHIGIRFFNIMGWMERDDAAGAVYQDIETTVGTRYRMQFDTRYSYGGGSSNANSDLNAWNEYLQFVFLKYPGELWNRVPIPHGSSTRVPYAYPRWANKIESAHADIDISQDGYLGTNNVGNILGARYFRWEHDVWLEFVAQTTVTAVTIFGHGYYLNGITNIKVFEV